LILKVNKLLSFWQEKSILGFKDFSILNVTVGSPGPTENIDLPGQGTWQTLKILKVSGKPFCGTGSPAYGCWKYTFTFLAKRI
jgi:hypothetical protein